MYGGTLDHGLMCNDDGILLCFAWLELPLVSLAGWIGGGISVHFGLAQSWVIPYNHTNILT